MKIVTSTQMKQIEQNSLQHDLTFYRLMENAGSAAAAFIRRTFVVEDLSCIIFCGKGNNGGDGLVVARKLAESGARVLIVLVDGPPRSDEATAMHSMVDLMELPTCDFESGYAQLVPLVGQADIIVDAIYGTGFKGRLDDKHAGACEMINSAIAAIISLDIPSGVECDTGYPAPGAVRADFTVVFDSYKPLHMLPEAAEYRGQLELVDIGIPPQAKVGIGREYVDIPFEEVLAQLPLRRPESHKGTFGWLLNVAGCARYRGAAALSTLAALRSGTGKVTLASTELVCAATAAHALECTFLPLPATPAGTISSEAVGRHLADAVESATAILFGCGLDNTPDCKQLLEFLLKNAGCPLVLDADGLNALAGNILLLKSTSIPVVLTPHPGEMARLMGVTPGDIAGNRHGAAHAFAVKTGAVVALKGHETVIASPDGRIAVNHTGNPGLAKGGSGDLLAGIIGGLLAQGLDPFMAAVCGVHLHGLAADKTALRLTQRTMLPSDILKDIHLDRIQDDTAPEAPPSTGIDFAVELPEQPPADIPQISLDLEAPQAPASSTMPEAPLPAATPDPEGDDDPPMQFQWME